MWWLKFKKYFSLLATLFSLFYCIGILFNLGDYEFTRPVFIVLYPLALLVFSDPVA